MAQMGIINTLLHRPYHCYQLAYHHIRNFIEIYQNTINMG